jgi:competence protein ComEA
MKTNRIEKFVISLVLIFTVSTIGFAQSATQSKTPATSKTPAASKAPAAQAKAAATKKAELIDINSATKEQLMTIPGIGDAISKRIIADRPYRAKNELVQKNILSEDSYDKIKDLIIAKQVKTTAAAKESAPKAGTSKAPAATKK